MIIEIAFDKESLISELMRLDCATLEDLLDNPSSVVFDIFVSHHAPALGAGGADQLVISLGRFRAADDESVAPARTLIGNR
jgi:hypothetical protein